jgi:putative Ca2+/H+ antiporter (TMEM165/GDT1 family)
MDAFQISTASVAVGELGNKTQIVALALAAKYNDLVSVVAATTFGMMIVNIPTVLFAERATKWVPLKPVRTIAAVIYAVLGVLTLLGYSTVKFG